MEVGKQAKEPPTPTTITASKICTSPTARRWSAWHGRQEIAWTWRWETHQLSSTWRLSPSRTQSCMIGSRSKARWVDCSKYGSHWRRQMMRLDLSVVCSPSCCSFPLSSWWRSRTPFRTQPMACSIPTFQPARTDEHELELCDPRYTRSKDYLDGG